VERVTTHALLASIHRVLRRKIFLSVEAVYVTGNACFKYRFYCRFGM